MAKYQSLQSINNNWTGFPRHNNSVSPQRLHNFQQPSQTQQAHYDPKITRFNSNNPSRLNRQIEDLNLNINKNVCMFGS